MNRVGREFFTGCLLGGAIGDALGAPVEFLSADRIREQFGSEGVLDFVEFSGNRGAFTDDTQMTLFTAEALLRAVHRANLRGIGGAEETIAQQSYLRWLYTQDHANGEVPGSEELKELGDGWMIRQKALYRGRAPGNSCLSSLRSGKFGSIEEPINNSKGCGTIMRVAPVGLMYCGMRRRAFEVACELSAITHGHPTGYLSAGFFASMISDLVTGIALLDSIRNAMNILVAFDDHGEAKQAVDRALDQWERCSHHHLVPRSEMIGELGEGWVAEEALAISLFCSLMYSGDFQSGVLLSVNHSGDSDSTGSITGNILGLINGMDQIPSKWEKGLIDADLVVEVAEDLYTQVKGDSFSTDRDWWNKYPGF